MMILIIQIYDILIVRNSNFIVVLSMFKIFIVSCVNELNPLLRISRMMLCYLSCLNVSILKDIKFRGILLSGSSLILMIFLSIPQYHKNILRCSKKCLN